MRYCPQCGCPLTSRDVDGAERKACRADSCGFVYWDNPIPVVAALVEYQGRIVLARNIKWPEGVFSVITGFLERNETPEQAVIREVKEELGLNGHIENFIGHYCVSQLNQLVLAYSIVGSGELKAGSELSELKQLTSSELSCWDFGPLKMTSAIVEWWLVRRSPTCDYAPKSGSK